MSTSTIIDSYHLIEISGTFTLSAANIHEHSSNIVSSDFHLQHHWCVPWLGYFPWVVLSVEPDCLFGPPQSVVAGGDDTARFTCLDIVFYSFLDFGIGRIIAEMYTFDWG
jgi:hypothetical protein